MHLTTRSSALVWAYMPFGPAFPNGVRMPSTKTTSWSWRGTMVSWFSRGQGSTRADALILLLGNFRTERVRRDRPHVVSRRELST